jgi:hypothetical protein
VSALEPRLSMLTISVAAGVEAIEHLEIKRDGMAVGSGSWATPVPVDPGDHRVEASAPGYKPFTATVTLATDGAKEVVVVPVLERSSDVSEEVATGSRGNSRSGLRYAGLAVGGAGVVGVVVGTVFGLRAIGLNNTSKGDCDAQSVCGPAGLASRQDSRSAGNVSTVAFVAGGVLLAGGATMFLLGKPRSSQGMALRAVPLVSSRELGIGFEGAF